MPRRWRETGTGCARWRSNSIAAGICCVSAGLVRSSGSTPTTLKSARPKRWSTTSSKGSRPAGAGVPEAMDRNGAFPRLDDDQRARLRSLGRVRTVEPGEVLFAAGDDGSDFFVVESGAVAIVQGYGEENRVIAVHGPHRFLGEISLLTGQRLYLSAVVRDAGELIQVPVEKLREIVAEDKGLSDVILGAFIARRAILIDVGTGIKLIGSRFSPDSRRLREFLARNRMPHQWIDLEDDDDAETLLTGLAIEPDQTPVVIASGGEVLRNPSSAELGRAIGLGSRGAPPPLCDVVVVGAGPAGIAASLYAASEGLDVQAVEAVASGGQAGTSARIENYLGFPGASRGASSPSAPGSRRSSSGPVSPRRPPWSCAAIRAGTRLSSRMEM